MDKFTALDLLATTLRKALVNDFFPELYNFYDAVITGRDNDIYKPRKRR